MKTTSRSIRIEGHGQTVDYIEHAEALNNNSHIIRIRIHSDTYAEQAYGEVEAHDGARWNEVCRVRGCALRLDAKAIGYKTMTEGERRSAFKADRDYLVKLAAEVLR